MKTKRMINGNLDDKYISTTTTAILNCRIVFLYIKRKKLKIATIKSNLRSTKKLCLYRHHPFLNFTPPPPTGRTIYVYTILE